MRLLLATPCFGRTLHQSYVSSLVGTVEGLVKEGTYFDTLFLGNESFIQRARNDYVHYALTSDKNYTHLWFIDADTGWEWEDFCRLRAANRAVISGVCPKKKYPIELVYNPRPNESIDIHGVLRVNHAPTGFMLLNLEMLRRLSQSVPTYEDTSTLTGKKEKIWNFFRAGPTPEGGFLPEDIGFTRLLAEYGVPVLLHTRVLTTHSGNHTFKIEREGT